MTNEQYKKMMATKTMPKCRIGGYITKCPKCNKNALLVRFNAIDRIKDRYPRVKCQSCAYTGQLYRIRKGALKCL